MNGGRKAARVRYFQRIQRFQRKLERFIVPGLFTTMSYLEGTNERVGSEFARVVDAERDDLVEQLRR